MLQSSQPLGKFKRRRRRETVAPKGLSQREALVAVLVPWRSRYRLDLTPCMNAAIQTTRRKSPTVTFLYTTLQYIRQNDQKGYRVDRYLVSTGARRRNSAKL
jgi:hypothetical protein